MFCKICKIILFKWNSSKDLNKAYISMGLKIQGLPWPSVRLSLKFHTPPPDTSGPSEMPGRSEVIRTTRRFTGNNALATSEQLQRSQERNTPAMHRCRSSLATPSGRR